MKVLVTGGGGFVGQALCRALRGRGLEVVSLSRKIYPSLVSIGVDCQSADIGSITESFSHHFKGVAAVFHVAAHVSMWGPENDFFRVNVEGSRKVLSACLENKVKALIFTSSPSVIADGKDLCGVDETYPYPPKYHALYPKTKAQAEREILSAHSSSLRTIALRPHLIFGPGDTNLIPTVVERAKVGKLRQIGPGTNLVDFTYIDDCVSAHLCAFDTLMSDIAVGGQPYFISAGDPVPLWEWIRRVVGASGYELPIRSVPVRLAKLAASCMEGVYRFLPTSFGAPPLTTFLVSEMSTNHYFNISAARNKLGYSPKFGVWEGVGRTFERYAERA